MGTLIELKAADGTLVPAYEARPAGTPKGAVVVIQEIFGVNSHIRAVADGYAAEGYLAVAPAMFHRVKPAVELGYAEADMGEGFGYKTAAEALPAPGVMQDIQAAIDHAAKPARQDVHDIADRHQHEHRRKRQLDRLRDHSPGPAHLNRPYC